MEPQSDVLRLIEMCLLKELSKDYHEDDVHVEYQTRVNNLDDNFNGLLHFLENADIDLTRTTLENVLSHVLILYLELQSPGPWNTEDIKERDYARKLNETFKNKYRVSLDDVIENNKFDGKGIFDICIEELHKKMTADNLKKYPTLIHVYHSLLKDAKHYNVNLNPRKVLPVALRLIDDYITDNKIKGLQACAGVLECLNVSDFESGNYYEVIYSSLKKNVVEKDKEVTEALFKCFLEFVKVVPSDVKNEKLGDIFSNVVDQLYSESNLYRKAICFNFLTKIIEMHGIHCVKKKVFKEIIQENIDVCSNESIAEILLKPVLECFEMWIRLCWGTWKLSADHKILSSLFKMLYLCEEEDKKIKIQNIIIILVKLCSPEEQADVFDNLQEPFQCSNKDFKNRIETIKRVINT